MSAKPFSLPTYGTVIVESFPEATMHRTTIMLPDDLRNRALRRAEELGVSLGELVRESLDSLLNRSRRPAADDPLFADNAVFRGESPDDLSENHDHHLYG